MSALPIHVAREISTSAGKKKTKLSAKGRGSPFAAFFPVELDSKEDALLGKVYYPDPNVYPHLITALAGISYRLSVLSNTLLALYNSSYYISRITDPMAREQRIRDIANRIYRNTPSSTIIKSADKNPSVMDQFISGVRTNFVIKPNGKGFDLQYVGLPPIDKSSGTLMKVSTAMSSDVDYQYSSADAGASSLPDGSYLSTVRRVPVTPQERAMMKNRLGDNYDTVFNNTIAQECVAAMQQLHKTLVGSEASTGTAQKRVMSTKPLDFSWKSLSNIRIDGVNIFDGVDLSGGITHQDFGQLKPRVQYIVIREPDGKLVKNYTDHYKNNKAAREAGTAEKPPLNNDDFVNQEIIPFTQRLAVSFQVHISEQVARYITQQPEGDINVGSLYVWASSWSEAAVKRHNARAKKKKKGSGEEDTRSKNFKDISHNVIPASVSEKLAEHRKEVGYYNEPGRIDENGMYINNAGGLSWLPSSDSYNVENAKAREEYFNKIVKASFELGAPVSSPQVLKHFIATQGDDVAFDEAQFQGNYDSLQKYTGSMLAYNWDFGYMITTSAEKPERTTAARISRATKPDNIALKSFLDQPFARGLKKIISSDVEDLHAEAFSSPANFQAVRMGKADRWEKSGFDPLFELYDYLWSRKLVPGLPALIKSAAKKLGITSLEDEKVAEFEQGLYSSVMTPDFQLLPITGTDSPANRIRTMLGECVADASGNSWGSGPHNLYNWAQKHGEALTDDLEHHYFDDGMSLHYFSRVYDYFGGQLFYQMCLNLIKVDPKALMVRKYGEQRETDNEFDKNIPMPRFRHISGVAMPLAITLAKYAPGYKDIQNKAGKERQSIQEDPSIDESNIKVPGAISKEDDDEGFNLMPHQMAAHRVLRNHPKFAVLDIAPGGGKTIIILTDIMSCKAEFGGDKIKPLVIVPAALLPGWTNDANTVVTDDKWNIVSLTAQTFRSWGPERLHEVITEAPPNTIFISSYTFLRLVSQGASFMLGGQKIELFSNAEFIKKYGFNYVALDESHRNKNPLGNTHKAIATITGISGMRFVRLMSGTVVSNDLNDIIGQAQLKGSHIYRTKGEFDAEYRLQDDNGNNTGGWQQGAAQRIKEKFKDYAAFITFKRRDWAFLLPYPEEEFIPLPFEGDDPNDPMAKFDDLHRAAYDQVLRENNEALLAEIEALEKEKKASSSVDDDDEDEDEDDPLKDAKAIQDMERLLTDPFGHDICAKLFADNQAYQDYVNQGGKPYVPNKIRKVVKRVKEHFTDHPWSKGNTYHSSDIVQWNEDYWILRRYQRFEDGTFSESARDKAGYVSDLPPSEDPENWKKEPRGKVIIVCRYIRTVENLYDSMPPDLQKITAMYSGNVEADEKDANIADFKNPAGNVKVLITLEASGSMEGHNMQAATRMIRVEIPWAPGDVEQTTARLFRPSPKNFDDGEMMRSVIWLDWIISDQSIEVAKYGRLISKMVRTRKFSEMDNAGFTDLLERCKRVTPADNVSEDEDPHELRDISTGYRALLQINTFPTEYEIKKARSDLMSNVVPFTMGSAESNGKIDPGYLASYFMIQQKEEQEFQKMRQTGETKFYPIEPAPKLKDARMMERVPVVPHQRLPDVHKYNLNPMLDWANAPSRKPQLKELEDAYDRYLGDSNAPSSFDMHSGTLVMTPFGRAVVTGVGFPKRTAKFMKNPRQFNQEKPFSKVFVKPANPSGHTRAVITLDPTLVWVAQNVPDADRKLFEVDEGKKPIKPTAWDRKGQTRIDGRDDQPDRTVVGPGDTKIVQDELHLTDVLDNNILLLYPVLYNGILTVEASMDDPDSAELKDFGFTMRGDYALAFAEREKYAYAVIDYLQSFFELTPQSKKRLLSSLDSFESVRTRKFILEQAPVQEMALFFKTKLKRVPKGKLNVIPFVVGGVNKLAFGIDLRTNPQIRPYMNKVIPGTAGERLSFANGMWMNFCRTKQKAMQVIKLLKQKGYTIENEREFNKALRDMNLRMPKANK